MVVFDKSGCTVLYFFRMFNLGSGVWIPYRRDILKFWSTSSFLYIRFAWSEGSFDHMVSYLKLMKIWKLCQ